MKYLIKDKEYEFDFDLTVAEAFILKEKAFLTITEFGSALQRVDPHAVCALMYLMIRRNREPVKWEDVVNNYKISDLVPVVEDEAAGAEDAPDPTTPAEATTKRASRSGGKALKSAT